MTPIATLEDLIAQLRQNPELREQLLSVLLTQELLSLPVEFHEFRAEMLDFRAEMEQITLEHQRRLDAIETQIAQQRLEFETQMERQRAEFNERMDRQRTEFNEQLQSLRTEFYEQMQNLRAEARELAQTLGVLVVYDGTAEGVEFLNSLA